MSDTEPKVWIRTSVEQMSETIQYVSIERSEWRAMTSKEQDEFLSERALEAMNDAGGCGASVVDENEVPDEWKEP